MNTKSLSPRLKPSLQKQKIVLRKLGSLTILSPKENESVNSYISKDSYNSLANSQLNSKLYSSSIKLTSPATSFSVASQSKLKAMADKLSPKESRILQSIPTESELPMSGLEVVSTFSNHLSRFELNEVVDYDIVYYLGLKAKKIRPNEKLKHKGFDDKDTDYMLVPGDHIAYQYEILEMLGSGSFSQVCKCLDHKSQKEVAVKILKSHKRFEEQARVEIKILSYLKKYYKSAPGHFVQMADNFRFRGHVCIIFELLSFNLYDLLKTNSFKGFSQTLVRRFAIQTLKGLNFLSDHNIIHCDLKPENIILITGQESLVKIIDFGSSCFENEKMYFYIQSRIYRAPEVILGITYTCAIDMWSFACIIVELITGQPLFQGDSEADQLLAIMEVLGNPPEDLINVSTKRAKFFCSDGTPKSWVNSKGKVRELGSVSLEDKLGIEDFEFLDFIKSKG